MYETTDRIRWPNRWGTVVVEIEETDNEVRDFISAHTLAYAMLYGRRDVELVTRLDLVL